MLSQIYVVKQEKKKKYFSAKYLVTKCECLEVGRGFGFHRPALTHIILDMWSLESKSRFRVSPEARVQPH